METDVLEREETEQEHRVTPPHRHLVLLCGKCSASVHVWRGLGVTLTAVCGKRLVSNPNSVARQKTDSCDCIDCRMADLSASKRCAKCKAVAA